ncbi:MAG: zinc ribbon domain-containing protein [Pyrinomonadaceae bacterium]
MFCPNCGKNVSAKLKYCSGCGERLSKAAEIDKDGLPGKMLDNILTTLFLVVMFGLGILVGLVAVLLSNNVEPKFVVFVAVAYLAAVFGICYTLLSQVPKLIDAKLKANDEYSRHVPVRNEEFVQLPPRSTNQLDEFREPASVTDGTTRTLDKIPVRER